MEEDYAQADWPGRASCRWVVYFVLWCLTVCLCLFACKHVVMQVGGAFLAFVLAASLPLIFATLFETAYSRRARQDLPIIGCPILGAIVVLLGAGSLQQASPLVLWTSSKTTVDSAMDLCRNFAGVPSSRLPRAVCVRKAFVKTDWEAGKLVCEDQDNHVVCAPKFAAAPVFDDKPTADNGLPKDMYAWAVSHGPHVIAAYGPDGSLCGYLRGAPELDMYSSNFHLAVSRVIGKYSFALDSYVTSETEAATTTGAAGISPASTTESSRPESRPDLVPLEQRPLLVVEDPAKMTSTEEAWLLLAVVLLCFCPCVGPIPLGIIFLFWCWAGKDNEYRGRRRVAPDDDDVEDDTVSLVKWRHRNSR